MRKLIVTAMITSMLASPGWAQEQDCEEGQTVNDDGDCVEVVFVEGVGSIDPLVVGLGAGAIALGIILSSSNSSSGTN